MSAQTQYPMQMGELQLEGASPACLLHLEWMLAEAYLVEMVISE